MSTSSPFSCPESSLDMSIFKQISLVSSGDAIPMSLHLFFWCSIVNINNLLANIKLQLWPFPSYILILTHWRKKLYENIVKKGEIAQNEQFHLFPQCFMDYISWNPLIATFQLLSAASLNLGWSQNGVLGNRLSHVQMKHLQLTNLMQLNSLFLSLKW